MVTQQMIDKPRNLSVYLQTVNSYELLYAGAETKVNDFMRFWALYRPASNVQIRYLNTMDGVTVMYSGEAGSYVKSRR